MRSNFDVARNLNQSEAEREAAECFPKSGAPLLSAALDERRYSPLPSDGGKSLQV